MTGSGEGRRRSVEVRRSCASALDLLVRFLLALLIALIASSDALYPSKRLVIYHEPLSWQAANTSCKDNGGRLATFKSEEEWEFLLLATRNKRNLFLAESTSSGSSQGYFWFGLHVPTTQGACASSTQPRWVDCSPLLETWNFSSLLIASPSSGWSPNIVACYSFNNATSQWIKSGCDVARPYVCENFIGRCDVTNANGSCHDNASDSIFVVDSPSCSVLCQAARADNLTCFQASVSKLVQSVLPYTSDPRCGDEENSCYSQLNSSCYSVERKSNASVAMGIRLPAADCSVANKTLTQTMTRYVLYNQSASWLEAKASCDVIGASLASLHSDYVINMVSNFTSANFSYWVGLSFACLNNKCTYTWADGSTVPPSPLAAPDVGTLTLLSGCVRRSQTWQKTSCEQWAPFLCQRACGRCKYDVQEYTTCLTPANQTRYYSFADSASCRALCDVETQSGLPCVAFEHQAALQECKLIFNASEARPFTCQVTKPANGTLFVKNCFSVTEDTVLWPLRNSSTIAMMTSSSSLNFVTTSDVTLSPSMQFTSFFPSESPTSSPYFDVTPSATAFLTPSYRYDVISSSDKYGVIATPSAPFSYGVIMTPSASFSSDVIMTPSASFSSGVINTAPASVSSDVMPTSVLTTDVSATVATEGWNSSANSSALCSCRCRLNSSLTLEQLEDLTSNLKVNKSELSATRRRLRSEPDRRPLATGLGAMGIFFLVCFFASFLLLDLLRPQCVDKCRGAFKKSRGKTADQPKGKKAK